MDFHKPLNNKVILVREGSRSQPPLFFVHDEIGSLTYASALAPYLSLEIPLYGLPIDSAMLEARCALQQIASRMVDVIRDIQPRGPYRLAGYSVGAILAYEIAVQLLGDDQKVEFLGMLDSSYSPSPERTSLENIRERLTLWSRKSFPSEEILTIEIEKALSLSQAFADTITQYRPQLIHAPVFLFSSATTREKPHIDCGWEHFISQEWLKIVHVLETSDSMMQAPNVSILGQVVSEAIIDAGVAKPRIIEQQYSPQVTLQTGRSGRGPLFCVPGAGATVVSFTDLVRRLGRDLRVYGLQPKGMDGLNIPHSSLAAAVTTYFKVIQEICPDGPLHLLGHSYGGWAVFELACRLMSAGRAVASVTIIDSMVPAARLQPGDRQSHCEILQQWIDIFEML